MSSFSILEGFDYVFRDANPIISKRIFKTKRADWLTSLSDGGHPLSDHFHTTFF